MNSFSFIIPSTSTCGEKSDKKITNATNGLIENMLVSFSKSKKTTPLLANNDVTNINNFQLQNPVNNINNKVTINTL
ncbi:hypothetical protein [Spiroplasma endosymbiont of Apeira syringaria]|uniref:hypothetical protein n=1 Tax=Spiroplasma endosymbiont of Apeira syringaria TaxID=3066307 RepID=UPI0030D0FC7E